MPEKALAATRFWQIWTLLGALGTALAGARLILSTSNTLVATSSPAGMQPKRAQPQRLLASAPTPAPSVDRLLARLAIAATATERCALLEQVQPSEDTQPTYAITALLERAQLGSVRACATQALSLQPTSEAQSFLVDLAEDPEPEVHRSALEALATRDETARAVVVEATHSEDLELRVSAVKALLKAKRTEGYAAAVSVLPEVDDPETLSSLIDALGESHNPQALPALEALLDNAERESHLHAISALGELGVPSAAARLEGLLELGSSEEFSAAAEALKKLTPARALPKLRAALASENSERQELALSALLSLEPPELPSLMRAQLESGDPGRIRLVLQRLNTTPDPSFEAELVAVLEHGEPGMQLPALHALSKLSTVSARAAVQRLAKALPDSLSERFLELASDNPEQLRAQRISALTGAEEASPGALAALARDPSEAAQSALLRYLEAHEVAAAVWATVVELAPSPTVQRIAERNAHGTANAKLGLLQGLGVRGDPTFADSLRADLRGEQPARNAALTALVQLGDESVSAELERLAKSDDAADRELAVRLFSARPDPAALQALERLGSDPEPQVLSVALQALQTRSPELVGKLAQRALRESAPEARADLLSSLGVLNANLTRPLFELALSDTDDSVAVRAVQSLANLQGAASAQRLLSLVNDSSRSEQVRAEAASGLRSLGGPLARANRALLDSLSEPEAALEFTCNPN